MTEERLHFVKRRNYQSIVKDKVVRLRYALFDLDADGQVLAYRDDLYYLHGRYGGAFPKVEEALEGLGVDAKVEVDLEPEDAYGPRDPGLVLQVLAEELPPEVRRVGAEIEGEAENGDTRRFRVTRVQDGVVTLDGNHPLAGRRLRFVLEVLDIREARPEEIEAGYAFAPGAGRGRD